MEEVKVQRRFPPQIAKRLETIDQRELATLLGVKELPKQSRWAGMIARIENDPIVNSTQFQEAWGRLRKDIEESGGLEFNHDRDP
jgi:hypothetical protein